MRFIPPGGPKPAFPAVDGPREEEASPPHGEGVQLRAIMTSDAPRPLTSRAGPDAVDAVQELFAEGLTAVHQRADQFLIWILLADWLMAVALAGLSIPVALAGLCNLPASFLVAE